jgi:hypothetical protein
MKTVAYVDRTIGFDEIHLTFLMGVPLRMVRQCAVPTRK